MSHKIVVSTPGKLILMGEHAAVYGQPALVAAVDPRARVVASLASSGLRIELTDLDHLLETTWSEVEQHADRSRRAWIEYAADPTPERFAKVGTGSPLDLVRVALGELAGRVVAEKLRPLTIRVTSRLPIGSGFGSSASIAVALVGGILTLLEGSVDAQAIDELVLEVERRQHGLPSGIDHLTVLQGGVLAVRRRSEGVPEFTKLETQPRHLKRLHVFQTGRPAETTGAVVASVRRSRDRDRDRIESLLDRMGESVVQFEDLLGRRALDVERAAELIRVYESCLEDLGVVPEEVKRVVRQVEEAGGAAKISGAGSLSGAAAGCLLVLWPHGEPAQLPPRLRLYERLAVELGADGFRVEEVR